MRIDFGKDDMKFLHDQLEHHLHEMETELAHTDKRTLRTELALDVTRLQGMLQAIEVAVNETPDDFA